MKESSGNITERGKGYAKVTLDMGEGAAGIQCPYCRMYFIVIATDSIDHTMKPIPCSGEVNYFCPCCGKNLKQSLAEMVKAG